MSPFHSTLLFGLIAAGVALAALLLVQRAAEFTRRNSPVAAAFAGGLVITIAVSHLIPEALHLATHAAWLILAGFGFGFVVHTLLGSSGHDHGGNGDSKATVSRAAAFAPVIAIALHSMLDGFIYSVTFAVNSDSALIAVTGLIIHEFPEAIICFVLLQRAGLSNGKSFVFAFLASGATTLAAAAISAPYAGLLDTQTLGILFALVAGLLLHVGAAHLIHEASHAGPAKGGLAVFAGAGVAALMALTHSHDHDHGHGHGHRDHDHAPISGDAHSDQDAEAASPPSLRATNPGVSWQTSDEETDDQPAQSGQNDTTGAREEPNND